MATKAKKGEEIKEDIKEEEIKKEETKKEKIKKQPIPHEKLNKECNNVAYKEITKEDMVNYILEYAPEDKAWFKQVVIDNNKEDKNKNKRLNFLAIKRIFCERYNPSIIPKSKNKESILDMVKDW